MIEIKNAVTEMKDACERFHSRLGIAKERTNELGERKIEMSYNEI